MSPTGSGGSADVTTQVPGLDLGAIADATNQISSHNAIATAIRILHTAVNRAALAVARPTQAAPTSVFVRLPPAPPVGSLFWITDSSTAVWGANIAGGGANKVLAVWNGTHYTVVGK